MKTEKNMLVAFILNLSFSLVEWVGGWFIGSTAIVSDAVHDVGDALSIGLSYLLERKSKQPPNEAYTYGYARVSAVGGLITTLFLLLGSAAMIGNAVHRLVTPTAVNDTAMILLAVVGVIVNFFAAMFTREGSSFNQKAVNLHMLEDVFGWVVVLVGAIVMRVTGVTFIDPLLSIGVSLFVMVNAIKNLKGIFDLFLEKVPHTMSVAQINVHLEAIDGVVGIHHLHLWSLDGQNHAATVHAVIDGDPCKIKSAIRDKLREHGAGHVTIEIERNGEQCYEQSCRMEPKRHHSHPGK